METQPITPNLAHRTRPAGTVVDTIVLHATAGGTLAGAVKALRDKGLGYHYLIDKKGVVHKGCPAAMETFHAGSSYGPHEAAAGVSRLQYAYSQKNVQLGRVAKFVAGCSVNAYTIGISFVNLNDGVDKYTTAQVEACAELIPLLKVQFPSLVHLTAHFEVSPKRKTDPIKFDLDAMAARVGLTVWRFPK
ncbi:MAG: N-acetylmuramoyl-L-alanine amidase [Fimbriimonadaceae bacterium]|nr:N-acetylmuramoyl-L-alanine amidase [Fimbriimonadaceae bacterium]